MNVPTPHRWMKAGLLLLGAPLFAQTPTTVVVPAAYSSTEAPNAAFWAISPFAARRQLLIDEQHLPGLRGKQLRSIWLRRNGEDASSFAAGVLQIDVTLSHAPVGADAARRIQNETRQFDAAEALGLGFATDIVEEEAWPGVIEAAAAGANTLSADATAALFEATITDTRAQDMADLVASAARPGLTQRIQAYRDAIKR